MRSSLKLTAFVALALALITSGCEGLPPLPPLLAYTPAPSPTYTPSPPPPTIPTHNSIPLPPPAPPLSPLPSVTKVAEKLRPAVVSIQVETLTPGFFLQPVPQQGAGSGVVIDPQGYIVTNNHVIEAARS
ncbi:MAG: hypothetical protein Q8O76_00460, partial [Chloroflexota bacterium]|nr:hypothetical protein [Chloroflexota bacterium]